MMKWTDGSGSVDRARLGALELEVEHHPPEGEDRAYANWFVGGPEDTGSWLVEGTVRASEHVADPRLAARAICAATAREMAYRGQAGAAGEAKPDRVYLGELGHVHVTLEAVDRYQRFARLKEEEARRELTRLLRRAWLHAPETEDRPANFRYRSRPENVDLTANVVLDDDLYVVVGLNARPAKRGAPQDRAARPRRGPR